MEAMMAVEKQCKHTVFVMFLLCWYMLGTANGEAITDGSNSRTVCVNEDVLGMAQRLSNLEKNLTERVAVLEARESVYKEERTRVFQYFQSLNEMIKRLMDIEKETDSIQKSIQKLNKEQMNTTNILQKLKSEKINDTQKLETERQEIMRMVQHLQNEKANHSRIMAEFNRTVSVISENSKLHNMSVNIDQIIEYINNKSDNSNVRQDQERVNAEMFESIKSVKENMKTETASHKEEIRVLFSKLVDIEESCTVAESHVQSAVDVITANLSTKTSALGRYVNTTIQNMQTKLDQLPQSGSSRTVAFSGTPDEDTLLQGDDILNFSNIYINTYDSYNISDGKFYIPVDGVYLLHLAIIIKNKPYCNAAVNKNDQLILQVYAGLSQKAWPTGSGAIATICAAGDRISVSSSQQFQCQFSVSSRLTIISV